MKLIVLFIIHNLAWAESSFSCHSSVNTNGSGSFTVTGGVCDDYSFKNRLGNVLKYGEYKGQAVYEFTDCMRNITFVCNIPSQKKTDCEDGCVPEPKPEPIEEMPRYNSTADGGGLSTGIIGVIVVSVIVFIIACVVVVIIVLWKKDRFKRCFQRRDSVI